MTDQSGDRQVFQGPTGPYVEQTPGAGPRHPDDVPLSPDLVVDPMLRQAKSSAAAHETRLSAEADAMRSQMLGVVDPRGELRVYDGWDLDRADAHARTLRGVVVALLVLRDHR